MSLVKNDTISDSPVRVLHVDDDSMLLDTAAAFVEHEAPAIEIVSETTPEAVSGLLARGSFDCVVSDYEMPSVDGLELLQTVRDEYSELPFILYTGKGSEDIAARALNAGATGYLQKGGPEQHRRLVSRIEHAVGEYRAKVEATRYSRVLQALDYPMYVVDDEPQFQYVNEAFAELTGYDREEIVGSPPGLIKTEAGVERSTEALRTVLSDDGPDTEQFEIDILPREGDPIPCRDHLAADIHNGEFQASVGILRDRTAEEHRREELVQKNERLEELVSVVSHDLRTPLQVATTASALARERGEAEHFDRVEAAHDRMDQMIDELLTLAREGMRTTDPSPVNIGELARTVWADVVEDDEHNLVVRTERTVEAEAERLRRLFENLLSNAIEHGTAAQQASTDVGDSHSGVEVIVGALEDGFYIADDGPGIPEDVRSQAFEPGFTTAADGTGLGLTIVGRIAEAHGWSVTIRESTASGARFEFTNLEDTSAQESPAPVMK